MFRGVHGSIHSNDLGLRKGIHLDDSHFTLFSGKTSNELPELISGHIAKVLLWS